jgi:hypothetical protein
MRLDWAIAEEKRYPTTPALTRFIKDSREEYRTLKLRLASEKNLAKSGKLIKALKTSR